MHNVCTIVIPLYKPRINEFEVISFVQCLKVLYNHNFCIITFKELDLSFYTNLLTQYNIQYETEFFDKKFFNGIDGYNRLMLSLNFYKRFHKSDYILIYQLDAYVFRDELDYWCELGYDYIGAPWGKDLGPLIKSEIKDWSVGNGGFSLRKVDSFIKTLSIKRVYNFDRLLSFYPKNILGWVKIILKTTGFRNNIKYIIKKNYSNEDILFCKLLSKYNIHYNIPSAQEASFFSFDSNPEIVYEVTNHKLPFGCHAWNSYGRYHFWHNFININNE